MPITDLWNSFEERAGTFADLTAVSTPEGTINFRTLRQLAGDLSRLFEARGITEGSHVALALPNSLAFAPVMLALFRMSVTTVLVSTSYRERELRGIAQGARPLVFVTTDGLVRALRQSVSARRIESLSLPNIGSLVLLFPQHAGGTAAAGSGARAWPAIPGAAIVKVTSGSTGAPKAIAVTAANLRAEAENVIATLGITPGERIYAAVPLFHSYGFDVGLLPMLYAGASLTLRDVFAPRGALDELSNREVAVFLGVPSMYRVLLETRVTTSPDLARVRYLLSSTAPLPANLISGFYERFRTPICQHYGSSETGAATNHVPSQVLARPSSAGLPANNVRIIIGDESGLEARPGETGEVIVQSGAVAAGYLSGSPPGEPRFADGTFRTGDVGRVDDAGFLYLSGRKDEVINVGGMKVSPPEVVAVLESHPAVREAAVVGITDPSGEEVVRAAVTLKAPSTEHALLSFCQDRLSSYKIPRRIDIRDELPRSASGKVRLRSEDLRP